MEPFPTKALLKNMCSFRIWVWRACGVFAPPPPFFFLVGVRGLVLGWQRGLEGEVVLVFFWQLPMIYIKKYLEIHTLTPRATAHKHEKSLTATSQGYIKLTQPQSAVPMRRCCSLHYPRNNSDLQLWFGIDSSQQAALKDMGFEGT